MNLRFKVIGRQAERPWLKAFWIAERNYGMSYPGAQLGVIRMDMLADYQERLPHRYRTRAEGMTTDAHKLTRSNGSLKIKDEMFELHPRHVDLMSNNFTWKSAVIDGLWIETKMRRLPV